MNKKRQQYKKYHEKYKAKRNAYSKEYQKAHPEKHREGERKYYERHKQAVQQKMLLRAFWKRYKASGTGKPNVYKCRFCGNLYLTLVGLWRHQERKHSAKGGEKTMAETFEFKKNNLPGQPLPSEEFDAIKELFFRGEIITDILAKTGRGHQTLRRIEAAKSYEEYRKMTREYYNIKSRDAHTHGDPDYVTQATTRLAAELQERRVQAIYRLLKQKEDYETRQSVLKRKIAEVERVINEINHENDDELRQVETTTY